MITIHKTCQHCGTTFPVRPKQSYGGGNVCACRKVRQFRTQEEIEEFLEFERIAIADRERTLLSNSPIAADTMGDIDLDALYEDNLCWNRRSRKCVADGVPDECKATNPDGTAPLRKYDTGFNGKLYSDDNPRNCGTVYKGDNFS